MCGVIGLIYDNQRDDMGQIAAELLKTLEYRGYDSTGAALQGAGEEVTLAKGVGAPSEMVHQLGIVDLSGSVFCGQVRWATFGAVTRENSQPHVVRCKTYIYGAHNGNVTNCDALKQWLLSEGHQVLSDNDGEMLVHTVEHAFALELEALAEAKRRDPEARRAAMRRALVKAAARLQGSYAAVLVDPISRTVWAVKQGSSLYFGLGRGTAGGDAFGIASSDLSSVLKLTRVVVPLAEGEMVEFVPGAFQVYAVRDLNRKTAEGMQTVAAGEALPREPRRSRLRVGDTALKPPFETFMEQEIAAQEQTCRAVITLFDGGTEAQQVLGPLLERLSDEELARVEAELDTLRDLYDDAAIRAQFQTLADLPAWRRLLAGLPEELQDQGADGPPEQLARRLGSAEAGFLADLLPMSRGRHDTMVVRLLDALLERAEVEEFAAAVERFSDLCQEALQAGGRIYVVCCGTSFHAAKAAALFFNELARVELTPMLPGEFRGQVARSLGDADLLVSVSQSGETKDLIDVVNDVIASGLRIKRVALVNNVNSTLAQEKSDLVIPLRCGPEVAVPATKSFINQMVVFYCLALHLGERRQGALILPGEREEAERGLTLRRQKLQALPALIRDTVATTDEAIERAAQMLYLAPSIHILATRITAVAREGALKVREVVLNHTEGFEASEFKHGPNTILGFNTLLGPAEVDALLHQLGRTLDALLRAAQEEGLEDGASRRLVQAATDAVLGRTSGPYSLEGPEQTLFERHFQRQELLAALDKNYPLVFVTGPEERDVLLTVSQINTHKIRGAAPVIIAEEHPALQAAAARPPVDNPNYQWVYITLPRTNDTLLTVFSSTVVLQRLALKMSLLKAAYLDRLGIQDHGVHPDVPKNVSKSITVD